MLDRRNQLWIARRKGVWRLDAARQRLSKIEALPKPSSEPGQSRFASDHLGRIWATNSYGEGIGVFQATSPSGRWIELPGLTATYAMHVCADGAAWIGTREGLLRVRGQAFGSVRIEANTAALNAPIHAITQTPDGRLWFRTPSSFGSWSGKTLWVCHQTGGHYRFWPIAVSGESAWTAHSQGGIFKLPNYLETPIADTSIDPEYSEIGAVSRLVSGSLDSLWICAEAGLYRLWCQDSRLERVANTDGLVINVMHETEAGSFWVGGPQGLRCLKDGKLVAVELGNGEHIEITAMFRSRDGQFWVGTVRGLAVYDERTSALRFFDESINLPKTSISGIFEDDRGRIWLNHDAGVSSVAITDLDQSKRDFQDWCDVTTFGVSDGLPGLNTSPYESTVVRGNDGRLWFVKDRGLAVVDSFNATSAQRPIIHLEEVTSDNLPVVLGAETQTKFRAPSRLSFRFSVASLQSSGEAMVQYQLENHDLTWQDAGKSRQVTYDYLGPDDYRFRIRARNHRGLWSHESEGFAFGVYLPFWKTKRFAVIVSALLIGFIVWYLRRTKQRIDAASHEQREQLVASLHDELGPRIAQWCLRHGRDGEKDEIWHAYRETLAGMRSEVDSVLGLRDMIATQASALLGDTSLALRFKFSDEITEGPIDRRLGPELSAMIGEALTNVLRHANATKVTVGMRLHGRRIFVQVEDNGQGFGRSCTQGNGLRHFHRRCQRLGGGCAIASEPGRGTTVTWTLPISRSRIGKLLGVSL